MPAWMEGLFRGTGCSDLGRIACVSLYPDGMWQAGGALFWECMGVIVGMGENNGGCRIGRNEK